MLNVIAVRTISFTPKKAGQGFHQNTDNSQIHVDV